MVDQLSSVNSSLLDMASPTTDSVPKKQRFRLPRFPQFSLNQKVTAIAIVLGALPVFGMGAASYRLAEQAMMQQAQWFQHANVTRLSDAISRYMAQRHADVQALAVFPAVTEATLSQDANALNAALDRVTQAYKLYSHIGVFDLAGNAIAQTGKQRVSSLSKQSYFWDTIQANRATISQPGFSTNIQSFEVYLTAPVKDASGKTIAILRLTLPLSELGEHLQSYADKGWEYNLVSPSNQIILTPESSHLGKSVTEDYPEFTAMQAVQQVNSRFIQDSHLKSPNFVSYSPWTQLEGLPDLNWQMILESNVDNAFAAQKNLFLLLALGTTLTAGVVSWLAALLANRLTQRITGVSKAVQQIGEGDLKTRVVTDGNDDEISSLGDIINAMAAQLDKLLQEQIQNSENLQRLNDATSNIHKTLDIPVILQAGVSEARKLLRLDRAIVYQFDQHWQGQIIAESVGLEFPSALGAKIYDPCFAEHYVEKYQQGRVHTIANVETADLDPCYRGQLEPFGIRANIVAPMVVDGNLVGLLVGHQCIAPRDWTSADISLFRQLALHIGNALEQVRLTEAREKASQASALAEERQQQKEGMQGQLLELLRYVEQAASGDLTVRANVTAGEIGIVADFFNSIIESLQQIVGQVKDVALQVNSSLGVHERAVRVLSQDALKQADETAATLHSVQVMMDSITAIAQSAQQAATVSRSAAETAEAGGQAMDLTVQQILGLRHTIADAAKKVKRLGESSQQISKVVSLINQITVQTNLLAINAGIEAARAGDDSQGFAAIAEEVGALAARASDATREIEKLIADIQQETSDVVMAMEQGTTQVVEGTHFVEDAKLNLERIVAVSQEMDHLVQRISSATVSQVETSQQISRLMQAMAQIAERTSDSSVEVSDSLRQTVEVARELQQSVETFRVG
jgi:twitching motility protein PilJ